MIWYHLYCVNHWFDVAAETLSAIKRADFRGQIQIHLVGSSSNAISLEDLAGRMGLSFSITIHEVNSFEQNTLHALWRYAQEHDGTIGYVHSKGTSRTSPASTKWRWMMTDQIISRWTDRMNDLREFDAVGCCYRPDHHWFAGNWWWARAEWVRGLAEPVVNPDRFHFEGWLLSRPGARIKPLISVGGEPCEESYYTGHGNPHLRFLEALNENE